MNEPLSCSNQPISASGGEELRDTSDFTDAAKDWYEDHPEQRDELWAKAQSSPDNYRIWKSARSPEMRGLEDRISSDEVKNCKTCQRNLRDLRQYRAPTPILNMIYETALHKCNGLHGHKEEHPEEYDSADWWKS